MLACFCYYPDIKIWKPKDRNGDRKWCGVSDDIYIQRTGAPDEHSADGGKHHQDGILLLSQQGNLYGKNEEIVRPDTGEQS